MPARVVISLPSTTGLPADTCVNTWHTTQIPSDGGQAEDLAAAFLAFYTAIGGYIGPAITRSTDAGIDVYDLSDPEPRQPLFTGTFALPTSGSTYSLPAEVALCTSFEAQQVSGSPAARRRGRVYIGPLGENVLSAGSPYGRPAPDVVDDLADATAALVGDLSTTGLSLAVFSRVDQVARAVVSGWVDNEFDTQRRRGRLASTRTRWTN